MLRRICQSTLLNHIVVINGCYYAIVVGVGVCGIYDDGALVVVLLVTGGRGVGVGRCCGCYICVNMGDDRRGWWVVLWSWLV